MRILYVRLYDFYKNFLHINDESLISAAIRITEIRLVKHGEYLIHAGELPTHLCFLMHGIVRGVMLDCNGKDITDCIVYRCGYPAMPDNDFTLPASIALEALADSEIVCIPLSAVPHLLETYPSAMELYHQLLLSSLSTHRGLKIATYQYTAAQRYAWFLKEYPGLIDQISHKYIASLLNMTPVTLSKVRNISKKEAPPEETPMDAAPDSISSNTTVV